MTRELKFRIRLQSKHDLSIDTQYITFEELMGEAFDDNWWVLLSRDQYTGLKDRNGKEIYEGDIVDTWSAGSHLTNGIIKYGSGRAGFFIGNQSNSLVWNLSGPEESLTVIGNIYETPELLPENAATTERPV